MNVYVESNYVLELALEQEQHEQCEHILALGEQGKVQLILPSFSLVEPYEKLVRQDKRRKQLADTAASELRELARSKPYQAETTALQGITTLLLRSGAEEKQRLLQVRDRILKAAEIIPLERHILESATQIEKVFSLSPQDSIVFASIQHHLNISAVAKKCFLTRDAGDFSDPDIEDALANRDCKIIFGFDNGYNYISSQR